MFYAQPSDHQFNPQLPGITWVDMGLPYFLFAMGVAIPISLSQRIARTESLLQASKFILQRTVLLGFFSIYIQPIFLRTLSREPQFHHWMISLNCAEGVIQPLT